MSTGYLLLAGLALAMAAIYGQVVVNDAMAARYIPERWQGQACSVRYFLGFSVSGLAAPLIAFLHATGGFPAVLTVAACFGLAIFGCAVTFATVAKADAGAAPQPAG